MASKKKGALSQYCRIFQYVEALDNELATAIRDLCMEGALSPGFGPGVTFLYPKEKALRDEIVEKTYSDADAAAKLVATLIVPDVLISGEDWQRRPVGNYSGVLYEVKSASGPNVVLKGESGSEADVKLKRDDGFKLRKDKESRLAVWTLLSGRPALSGAEYKRPGRPKGEKKGAERKPPTRGGAVSDRTVLATRVESAYHTAKSTRAVGAPNPYLTSVVGLLNHLKANNADLLRALLPLLDWCPEVDFYLLVEPYKRGARSEMCPDGDDYLIPEAVLFGPGGWNGADAFGDPVAALKDYMNSISKQGSAEDSPMVFRNTTGVVRQIDAVRQQIQQSLHKTDTPARVYKIYEGFAASNSIAGMHNILPAETVRLLPGQKKFWQDQLRFLLQHAIGELCAEPRYSRYEFMKIVQMLRCDMPGDNYKRELRLCDVEMLKRDVAPNAAFHLVVKFLRSTDFLYVPIAEGKVGGARGGAEDPTDHKVYNRNYEALSRLGAMSAAARSSLSSQALSELRMYVGEFGQLPPEVLALTKKE